MTTQQIGVTARDAHSRSFPITVVGLSLIVFLVISYLLYLIGYLVFSELPISIKRQLPAIPSGLQLI